MRRATTFLRFTTWIVLVCFVSACAGTRLPETDPDVDQWFTMQLEKTPPPDAEPPIILGSKGEKLDPIYIFPAAFEDVWRAIQMANDQSLAKTIKADKAAGVILIDHSGGNTWPPYSYHVGREKINVVELGPERTGILSIGKSYTSCSLAPPADWIIGILSIPLIFGISYLSNLSKNNEICEKLSKVHFRWYSRKHSDQWIMFIRNNLYAMGAMQP